MEFLQQIDGWFETKISDRKIRRLQNFVAAIARESKIEHSSFTVDDIHKSSMRLKEEMRNGRDDTRAIMEAFKLASLATKQFLGYYPNQTQIAAALVFSNGNIIEMRPGEGKTLVALIAAYLQVLRGFHVDIATTNDYLAERDQQWMGLLFGILGAEAGLVISTTPRSKRRLEYAKDITYVANQELGFDYLNDNLAPSPNEQVSGSRDFVIIDEVDSILLDEARTALIITEPDPEAKTDAARRLAELQQMFAFVKTLAPNRDYIINYAQKTVSLTDAGIELAEQHFSNDIFRKKGARYLWDLWYVLYTWVFLKADEDFIIENGKITLVDESTGHALPDRVLFKNLQESVEAMTGAKHSGEFRVTASITYREFFRLYKKIAGMTGTAFSARDEFFNLYGLRVMPFRPQHGSLRHDLPTKFFRIEEEKIAAVMREAERAIKDRAPLLIVGRTVAAAKTASALLQRQKIPHQLLHAAVGTAESEIIRNAGNPGIITVATNMAGRGADIVIEQSMREKSGLRVLGMEHNHSQRVDDQLRGRAGRQGQFGETQMFESLDDELLQTYGDDNFWNYAETVDWKESGVVDRRLTDGVRDSQKKAEEGDADTRLTLSRFESVISRHRNAAYSLRQEILVTPAAAYWKTVLPRLHRMLFNEEFLLTFEDFLRLCGHENLSGKMRRALEAFAKGNFKDAEKSLPLPSGNALEEFRRVTLRLFDKTWQQYLDNVQWLEGWISFTAVAQQDPLVAFAETTDRMFHDMRREFSMNTVEAFIA